MPKALTLDDRLIDYLHSVSLREPEVLRQLRAETAAHPRSQMQIAPEQGQFMALLVELLGARRILEIGCFTGYSSLAMSLALPADGYIDTCDVDEETTAIARHYWQAAGQQDKITLHLGPALDTLKELPGPYDLVFLDADKVNYDAYLEASYKRLRAGGLILIDNVLWSGAVADESVRDPDTEALRALNRKLQADSRFTISMLPLADGLTLARKR
ncbi:MAG: class I SAM-dependent methyltransferase [Candidatus Eremiobacteraeota bacterium]|nr:class I SAM-dependent methyltransferase [Candidatus Eremiobacteraeota bacterium]MCW5868551.1 class I SAM-dependent methyltransferase [Candidatus Eremiobacteraeota bacterium]